MDDAQPPSRRDLVDYETVDIADEDNPEWTEADFAAARPAREVLGDAFVDAWEKARRDGTLVARSVRDVALSAETVDFYVAQGPGWELRLDEDLKDLVRIKTRA